MPWFILAVSHRFEVAALAFGCLLILGALLSGLARRTFVSLTAVFVIAGFILGDGVTGIVHLDPRSPFVSELATVALIVILFRDGLEVDGELLQSHWHLPLRKLVLAMPLTAVIIAGGTRLLTGLSWTESFLVGALLSPTDPVLSSTVVTNPRVPAVVRHSLNLESGLNDGLALPAVLALSAALVVGGGHFVWWRFVIENLVIGFVVGVVLGFAAAWLAPRDAGLKDGIPAHQRSLFALGTAFATYGVAVLTPHGNGLIAVYVAAIVLGVRRPDVRGYFERQAADIVELVKLGIFVVFGSLLTLHGLFGSGWAAVGVVIITLLVARPIAVFAALAGTRTDVATRAFMSWFGPKGVATMTFSLLVLSQPIGANSTIFNLAALTVFCSILAHGATDTAGAEWLARRAESAGDG
ncbi:MAG TPA: sodium:proton antiporter [Solirubrobacteraceae bacterium]|jgi:NhaP-type Na+/H+ or K+/H+ antiporter|nr:sodium:proton antiporter [Solirubrobacteraceae bacterium]